MGAAFGVQSGRGAFAGMISAALIPIVGSIFGGTRLQASSPTAPMTAVSVLVIASAYSQFGAGSDNAEQFITLIFLLNALFLVVAGIIRLGNLISFVPQLVVLGFMNGIALLIWQDQIKKLFGLGGSVALGGNTLTNVLFAIITFAIILGLPFLFEKLNIPKKIALFLPATLFAVVFMSLIFSFSGAELERVKLGASVGTVSELVSLPAKFIPTASILTTDNLLKALPFAFQLTLLAYFDSLLTSMVIDKLIGEKTGRNKELMAQGLANGTTALFGGIPAAQSTVASVILIKEGAKTRLAGVFVGIFSLIAIFAFQGLLTMVASAIFIGVLFNAGLNVFDRDFFIHYFQKGWYKLAKYNWQLVLIAITTAITVFIDLNVAVIVGTSLFYLGKKFFNVVDVDDAEFTNIATEG